MDFIRNLTPEQKIIVFCGKKAMAIELTCEINLNGIRCQALHGDREQVDREQALLDITSGEVQILIATDLASRGLDIDNITYVFLHGAIYSQMYLVRSINFVFRLQTCY